MRLSNIFEAPGLTPSPEMGMNPAPKPGSAPAAAAVSGANAMRGVTGQGGSAVAKALGALGSGKTLTPGLAKALDPYADALTTILSDPQLRTKFVQLMKQAQAAEKTAPVESVTEDQDSVDAVAGAITRRIMMQHTDLLSKYGPVKVMAAIDDVADFAGSDGLDEIGSSDVSIWTKQVIQDLESGHFDHMESVQEAEGDKPYICLYVKKGKVLRHECYAPTSYEAAKKAAQHWGLKSTAGVSAHLADDSDDVKESESEQLARLRELSGLPTTEGMVDVEYGVDPKLQKLVDVGHLLRKTLDVGSGVKWDDADFNKAASLADALISLGSTFGPKSLKDALKLADLDLAQAQDLIAKASNKTEAVGDYTVKTISAADAWKKHTEPKKSKSKVPVDPKTGKTLYQKVTSEEVEEDKVDTVTMDIPLLLRMLEFAREDAQEDMDLHDVAERMIALSKEGPLNMDDYDSIVGSVEALPSPEEKPVEEGYYAPGPETMPGAVGPQENTTVSFNQSKTMGDATLNVSASAKDMDELHRILKLAGINYDSDGEKQEPSMQDVAVALEPEAPAEEPCGCEVEEPADVKYTTDKQTLINVLRDKLQKRLA